jgi:hypothetical protein
MVEVENTGMEMLVATKVPVERTLVNIVSAVTVDVEISEISTDANVKLPAEREPVIFALPTTWILSAGAFVPTPILPLELTTILVVGVSISSP